MHMFLWFTFHSLPERLVSFFDYAFIYLSSNPPFVPHECVDFFVCDRSITLFLLISQGVACQGCFYPRRVGSRFDVLLSFSLPSQVSLFPFYLYLTWRCLCSHRPTLGKYKQLCMYSLFSGCSHLCDLRPVLYFTYIH